MNLYRELLQKHKDEKARTFKPTQNQKDTNEPVEVARMEFNNFLLPLFTEIAKDQGVSMNEASNISLDEVNPGGMQLSNPPNPGFITGIKTEGLFVSAGGALLWGDKEYVRAIKMTANENGLATLSGNRLIRKDLHKETSLIEFYESVIKYIDSAQGCIYQKPSPTEPSHGHGGSW